MAEEQSGRMTMPGRPYSYLDKNLDTITGMAADNSSEQTAPQIGVALSELEKQSQALADIARKLQDRLSPVMRPQVSVLNEAVGKDRENLAPLTKGMNIIKHQMQDTYLLLETITQNLEI